jgi:excisionase family DNA binding protein
MSNADVDRENTWLSIQEAADHLGVNPRTVRRYIKVGRLSPSRISNKVVRIRLADIDRLMESGLAPVGRPAPHKPQPAKPAAFRPGTF